jgi:hypothetical protein
MEAGTMATATASQADAMKTAMVRDEAAQMALREWTLRLGRGEDEQRENIAAWQRDEHQTLNALVGQINAAIHEAQAAKEAMAVAGFESVSEAKSPAFSDWWAECYATIGKMFAEAKAKRS